MAENYLITGYWGEPHVTAENDRGINAAMFGAGRFVLPVGEQFRAEYIGNNTVRMYDGKLMDNGAAAGIPAGEYIDLLIPEAGQGMKRNDLIIFQYSKDNYTLVESGAFIVLSGEETSGTASDPVLSQQDILTNEANFDQMAMWRVSVSGATISAPVQMFAVRTAIPITSEVPEGVDIWIDPDDTTLEENHLTDRNNPHGVSIEQIGAAPAGWGIGKLYNYLCADDAVIDSVLISEINSMGENNFKRIVLSMTTTTNFSNGGGHYYANIYKESTNYAIITIKSYIEGGRTMQRIWFEGELKPWEWVNPPMIPNVEYRTTKRHNGKVVYTKLVEFMALPNNAEKSVNAMPANSSLVSAVGYASGASYNVPIPGYYGIKSIGSTRSSGALWLSTSIDMSSYNGWITIEYTK